ncbi:hypothetical protein D3C86_1423290 [compost metagenome]
MFDRHPLDPRLQADQGHGGAHIQGAGGAELAVVKAAIEAFELDQAIQALDLEHGVVDGQFVQGQQAKAQVGLQVEFAQAVDGQQFVLAPGGLGRCVGQGRVAGAGQGAAFAFLDLRLACRLGAGRRFALGRQVAVGVELVALQLHAQGLLGEVFHGQAATEQAVVHFQVEVFERQAGLAAFEAADHFELAQAAFGHGRQSLANAVEEGAQVQLGDG